MPQLKHRFSSSRVLTRSPTKIAQMVISLLLLVESSISQYYFSVSSTISCPDVQRVGEISRSYFKDASFYYETITSGMGYAAVLKYPVTGSPTLQVDSTIVVYTLPPYGRICTYSRRHISEGNAGRALHQSQDICKYEG